MFNIGSYRKAERKHGKERGSVKEHHFEALRPTTNTLRDEIKSLYDLINYLVDKEQTARLNESFVMARTVASMGENLIKAIDLPDPTYGVMNKMMLSFQFASFFEKLNATAFKNTCAALLYFLADEELIRKEAKAVVFSVFNSNIKSSAPPLSIFIKEIISNARDNRELGSDQEIMGRRILEVILLKINTMPAQNKMITIAGLKAFIGIINEFAHIIVRVIDQEVTTPIKHKLLEESFGQLKEKFSELEAINGFASTATHMLIKTTLNTLFNDLINPFTIKRNPGEELRVALSDEDIMRRELVIYNPKDPSHVPPEYLVPVIAPTFRDFLMQQEVQARRQQVGKAMSLLK